MCTKGISLSVYHPLELLDINGDACLEMPELELADAMNLFLYHARSGKQFAGEEDKRDIELCVKRCYFHKGDGQGYHYHPLALEALGLQLSCLGEEPSEWVKNLSRSYLENVADLKYWLCLIYKEDGDGIQRRLHRLKVKGLLEEVDLASGTISMHDLYREFAELEANGELDKATNMENRRWVHVDKSDLTELESVPPGGGCWHRLVRLRIGHDANEIESLEGIEWHYFANGVVLKLRGLNSVGGVLSLEHLKCLRSLDLYDNVNLHRLEGLEGLRHLTYFRWSSTWYHFRPGDMRTHIAGQFPPSLKFLQIEWGVTLLGPGVLARCNHLCKLFLWRIEADDLDLSNCWSLQSVMLHGVIKLRTLSGLTASWASRLEFLEVQYCNDLVNIPGLHHLVGLERLVLDKLGEFKELSDLQGLTKLQVLHLFACKSKLRLRVHAGPWRVHAGPQQLQELCYDGWAEVPNLDGFGQLQVLDLSWSVEMTCMGGAGDLSALRCLKLRYCRKLLQLPDLSKLRNLEELDLRYCDRLELHEEDIHMLAELPQLQPVRVASNLRLDLVRRKVLRFLLGHCPASWLAWQEGDWEESDLGIPPVKVGFVFLMPRGWSQGY